VGSDGFLDLLYVQCPQLAVGALLLAADADEVGICPATAFGMADDQPTATLTAEDAALQVVRVLAVLFAGQVLGGQQLLHPLPRLVIDQRLVLALIERALVADDPDVVGMAQQRMEMRDAQRQPRRPPAGNSRQSTGRQLGQQTADRPIARRIRLERPAHQRPPHRINLHRAAFAAVVEVPDVQVADGRTSWCAAILGLLHAALDDLSRQVATVELGNRTHDAV
jgi:hypothetical protein